MHDEWIKTEPIRDNINLDAFVVMPIISMVSLKLLIKTHS